MAVSPRATRRRYVLVLLLLTGITLVTLDRRLGDDSVLGPVGRWVREAVQPVSEAVDDVFTPVGEIGRAHV